MEYIPEKILKLFKQLYPTGRAFRVFDGSWREALCQAYAERYGQTYEDAVSILDSMIPDNDNFSAGDATDWERRFGMITNELTALATRKTAIETRMAFPGLNPARSHYLRLERLLQAAGFNVFVFENIPAVNPETHNANLLTAPRHGNGLRHGMTSGYLNHVVANSLDNDLDIYFNPGDSFRAAFFVSGTPVGTYASVPASREMELRQLIAKYKPTQNAAYLFITYS